MGDCDATGIGCSLGSNRLENIDMFLAAIYLVIVAAARLIALVLIARRLSADEAAAPALAARLDTGVQDGAIDGRLPTQVLATSNVQRQVTSLIAYHALQDRKVRVIILGV